MTRVPNLERALHQAARRLDQSTLSPDLTRRPNRWRLPLLATVSTLAIAGGAIAATGVLQEGDPVSSSPRFASTLGEITPGTTRLLNVRAADPDGGLPWTLRVFRTRDGRLACTQIGRTQNGQLGAIGRYGAFNNDGKFHRVGVTSLQDMSCGGLPESGELRNRGLTTISASGSTAGTMDGAGLADTRVIRYGFAGPDAKQVELRAGTYSQTVPVDQKDSGAYVLVSDGRVASADATFEVVYDDGARCPDYLPKPGTPTPRLDPRCNRR